MEKFKQYLLAIAGLVIFISAATLLYPVQITGAPPAKDVNVINDANNPVPVTVQNGANNDGMPFEFADTFSNPAGTVPDCFTPHTVFSVPTGETFTVTDMLLQGVSIDTLSIQRDGADLLFPRLNQADQRFTHTFKTGLRFEEGEALGLTITGAPLCGPDSLVHFLITGIRTTA